MGHQSSRSTRDRTVGRRRTRRDHPPSSSAGVPASANTAATTALEVAIIGRPNVGKSTLFNRLVGGRVAIVHDTPGVTRDRKVAFSRWNDQDCAFTDTGGFEADDTGGIGGLVGRQSRLAIAEAAVVICVFDGRAGLSPTDRDAVALLRRAGKPVVYAVNKIDTARQSDLLYDFARLGVDPLIAISAEHGRGIDELMDAVIASAPTLTGEAKRSAAGGTRVALVGRPNVGKSSLLNRLVGYERSIVNASPGTTRDPIDTPVLLGARPYVLVDTAGVRRRSRITEGVERLCVARSLRAISRAEIVLLLVDAVEGITDQDARIAAYAWKQGRGMAFVVNKWDLVAPTGVTERAWIASHQARHPAFAAIPILCMSTMTGWHLDSLPALVEGVDVDFGAQFPTSRLNQILQMAQRNHGPPVVGGRAPRFLYATQVGTRPPSIAVFTTDPDRVQASYVRYLRSRLSEAFGVRGAPLQLDFRERR